MFAYLLVALGGAIGSVGRFWLSGFIADRLAGSMPWNTLVINVTGSFAIALFAGLTDPSGTWIVRPEWRQFFMIGICGGYTTFSSFSLQTLNLLRDQEYAYAGLNILGSVILCLVAAWLGLILANVINHTRGY